MTTLNASTALAPLLKTYPFLVDFLVDFNPHYTKLKNPILRATVGRFATLGKVAVMGDVPLPTLLDAIRGEVARLAGDALAIEGGADATPQAETREARVEALRAIIEALHDGLPLDQAKTRFDQLVGTAEPGEIAAMEQALIRGGMPVHEIQRLCDLHVGVVKGGLSQQAPEAPAGHPVHTYLRDNELITGLADKLGALAARIDAAGEANALDAFYGPVFKVLEQLRGIDNHYVRKENELFPFLERHGITGPSQVMWGVHDEIRAHLAAAHQALRDRDTKACVQHGTALARALIDMVFKENQILFPLALETLTEDEWARARRGEDELGYAFARPAAVWPDGHEAAAVPSAPPAPAAAGLAALVGLGTGQLAVAQLDLILKALPVDITFVDADGYVRYYSDNPHRIFPRSPAAIGRHVDQCHPPKSLHKVRAILDAFAAGTQREAEFWIEHRDRFVHIRYLALRDADGHFVGTLEVSQDLTELRALQGQRRLLDWDTPVSPCTGPVATA